MGIIKLTIGINVYGLLWLFFLFLGKKNKNNPEEKHIKNKICGNHFDHSSDV